MKKLIITTAIILGLCLTSFAGPNGGGLFQRGESNEQTGFMNNRTSGATPALPNHGLDQNQNAPVGSGIALLLGIGGAYLVAKKRKEKA